MPPLVRGADLLRACACTHESAVACVQILWRGGGKVVSYLLTLPEVGRRLRSPCCIHVRIRDKVEYADGLYGSCPTQISLTKLLELQGGHTWYVYDRAL